MPTVSEELKWSEEREMSHCAGERDSSNSILGA